MDGVTALLAEARAAGLAVHAAGGKLAVRGPRRLEPLVRRLLDRKGEVLHHLLGQDSRQRSERSEALGGRVAVQNGQNGSGGPACITPGRGPASVQNAQNASGSPRPGATEPSPDAACDLPDASPARVLVGDNLGLLHRVRTGSVHLVPTDPPFNIRFDYPDHDDDLPVGEYLDGLRLRFAECKRVLADDGALLVAIAPRHQHRLLALLEDLGLHWRNTIIWHYAFGPRQKHKLTPSYTPIHYLAKHPTRFTFDADAVRVPSARQLKYADKRANPKGKVPDDLWLLDPECVEPLGFFDPAGDVWHVPRVCGTFRERAGHVCQMPVEVLERIVRMASREGDLVLDPWAGTGTALVVAVRTGRRALGFELSPSTAAIAEGRVARALDDPEERAAIRWEANLTPGEKSAAWERSGRGMEAES
jgi:site-specific DNA-methyltransferase (adenine-specific)